MPIWVGGVILPSPPSPCWFSLNNSKIVKAVTLVISSIQQLFIRDILANVGITDLLQSPDIRQNSEGGISDFRISGQSLIYENCHNSRTSHDNGIKLGTVTKPDKRKMATSKNDHEVMSANCDSIFFFPIFWLICSHPEAIFRMHGL